MIRGTEPLLGDSRVQGRAEARSTTNKTTCWVLSAEQLLAAGELFDARDPAWGFAIFIATTWKVAHRETART
jgi:hypothetical protein